MPASPRGCCVQAKKEEQLLKRRNISIEPEASPLTENNGKVTLTLMSFNACNSIPPQGLLDFNKQSMGVTEILEKINSDDPGMQLIGVQAAR